VVLVAVILMALVARRFLQDPRRLAPTRDPAWYTWHARVLLRAGPALMLDKVGPFGMFSRGYRVTTPVLGAVLARIGGVDPARFTVFVAVGLPVLTALACGAFAFRHKLSRSLHVLTMLATVGLLLTTPFIGYMDDLMCLFLLGAALPFLEPARTSWGPRSAVAGLVFLATLTHPTTVALFVAVLGLAVVGRFVGTRLSVRRTMAAEGPVVASVGAGLVLGLAAWWFGLWGPSASISDAALAQPYTQAFFRSRLTEWVRSIHPASIALFGIAAFAWIGWELIRRHRIDRHSAISVLWLLPLVGTAGYVLSKTYPYYRFINLTLAPMLLVGLGAWAASRALGWVGTRVGDRRRLLQATGVILAAVALVALFLRPGLRQWNRQSSWVGLSARVTDAGLAAYTAAQPDRPVVFVIHPRAGIMRAWGLAKQDSNLLLAALNGDTVPRAYVFVGDPDDFFRRTPTVTGYPIFDRLSRGFLADVNAGLPSSSNDPVVVYLPGLNRSGTPPSGERVQTVTPGFSILEGPGAASLDGAAKEAALRAEQVMAAAVAHPPGRFADPGHLLRVAGVLLLVLVTPGLIARRWFEVRDVPSGLALVPATSMALVLLCGILVVAVHRAPFGTAEAWIAVLLANGAAAGLGWAAQRRSPPSPGTLPPRDEAVTEPSAAR
jgi:hypothetical protein